MGKVKHMTAVLEFFQKTPIVSSKDMKLFVKKTGYSHLMAANLIKNGKIKRIVKGFYTTHEDPSLSVFCFRPAYIGMQEALSIHEVWEQETGTVIITAKKVKHSLIKVFGNNVVLHRIKPKYMFGFDIVKYGDFFIPVSDLEKTFIDMVYFNEIPDKETLKRIKRKINGKKLMEYLRKYHWKIKKRVMSIAGL